MLSVLNDHLSPTVFRFLFQSENCIHNWCMGLCGNLAEQAALYVGYTEDLRRVFRKLAAYWRTIEVGAFIIILYKNNKEPWRRLLKPWRIVGVGMDVHGMHPGLPRGI